MEPKDSDKIDPPVIDEKTGLELVPKKKNQFDVKNVQNDKSGKKKGFQNINKTQAVKRYT